MARLHLVALPHRTVGPESCGCAYQSKVFKMCKMLGGHHEILLYAPQGNPVPGATLVECLTERERIKTFGTDDENRLPDWPTDEQSRQFNLNVAVAIHERADPHDLVLLSGGLTHLPVQQALQHMICVESGIGYEGIIGGGVFGAYESNAWRHYISALRQIKDVRWFDRTIPNYFDVDEFPELNSGQGEYLLTYGRAIQRKGHHIALDIAKACGLPLVVAGAGWKSERIGSATSSSTMGAVTVFRSMKLTGLDVTLEGNNVHYVGPVDIKARSKLLAGAKAVIVATTYLEPFGGVSVEANFAGTPAITSPWGAFTETVEEGVTGFRFSTLREAVKAVERASSLSPEKIRARAIERFSLQSVSKMFDDWFVDLQSLFGDGWYAR